MITDRVVVDEFTSNEEHNGFEPPTLIVIGPAQEVVKGVSGSGDDLFGFTFPEFEYQSDDGN